MLDSKTLSEAVKKFFEDFCCEHCECYNVKHGYCNRPFEHLTYRKPTDFCSGFRRREENR